MKILKGIGIYLAYLALAVVCIFGVGVCCKIAYKVFIFGFNSF